MRPAPTILLPLAAALAVNAAPKPATAQQAPKPVAAAAQQAPKPVAAKPAAAQQAPKPAQATAKQAQESGEQNEVRETLERLLSRVNESWFGSPYRDTRAMDIKGTLALAIKGGALDAKIEQLTGGAIKSPGVRSGQALCTLEGTYFANGNHIYNVAGDLGRMRFQRIGEKGYWYIQDQNVYSTAIDSMPKDAPVSYMGWFAGLMQDIKNVYANASTFRATRGKDATVSGKAARTLVFDAPTAAYDPKKREQAASDTFSFWKKGHMEIAYEEATMQPLRMAFSNAAQGVEATMSFRYNKDGRIQAIDISNKSKQWDGPGSVTVSYGPNDRLATVSGELTGPTHKIMFNVSTTWSGEKDLKSVAVPATAMKLGREDMELRLAMMFADSIGNLQRGGFNFMAPKLAPAAQPARLAPAAEAK